MRRASLSLILKDRNKNVCSDPRKRSPIETFALKLKSFDIYAYINKKLPPLIFTNNAKHRAGNMKTAQILVATNTDEGVESFGITGWSIGDIIQRMADENSVTPVLSGLHCLHQHRE